MVFGVPEELLPLVAPIAVYWVGSGIYSLLMGSMEKHRLFTDEEEDAKNLVIRRQALTRVLLNQALQMAVLALSFLICSSLAIVTGGGKGSDDAGTTPPPGNSLAVAVLVMDSWQYFWHRWVHENKFMYKHVHSVHHRLVVPYAYGAQYIHPLDSLFGDAMGGAASSLVSGMSPSTSAVFFSLVTLKGLDDHSGLWFPGSPPAGC